MLHSKAIQWLAIWKDVIMPSYGNMIDLIFFFNVCADNKPVSIVAHWLKHIAPIHECDMNRNWRPNIRKFLLENLHLLKFINIFRVTLFVHMIRQPMAMRVSIVCQKSDRYLSVAEPIRAHFNWFLEQTLMWKETLMWTGNECDMELMNGNLFGISLKKKMKHTSRLATTFESNSTTGKTDTNLFQFKATSYSGRLERTQGKR